MIKISILSFGELSNLDLHSLMTLRAAVFVVEQACIYQDPDKYDTKAMHCLVHLGEQLVGCARIIAPNDKFKNACSIGRVCIESTQRNKGIARKMMKACIAFCQIEYEKSIVISAQTYLEAFYASLGFERNSSDYDEDGIPHLEMLLAI